MKNHPPLLTQYRKGLLFILLIYALFYLLFVDAASTVLIPRKIRHVIKFITTVSVYLIGTYHIGKAKQIWMEQIWHLVHISLLCIITGIGLYDWTFGMVTIAIKEVAASMQEFLISPILYIGMGILQKSLHSPFPL